MTANPIVHVLITERLPPVGIDAVIVEQDTELLLDTRKALEYPKESYGELVRQDSEGAPRMPGTVLVQKGAPLELLAIVMDFSAHPACRPEWVYQALSAAFRIADTKQLQSLAMPALGTLHGKLPLAQFAEILGGLLVEQQAQWPSRLIVCLPVETRPEEIDTFYSELNAARGTLQ